MFDYFALTLKMCWKTQIQQLVICAKPLPSTQTEN